jgi:hypothetical protein
LISGFLDFGFRIEFESRHLFPGANGMSPEEFKRPAKKFALRAIRRADALMKVQLVGEPHPEANEIVAMVVGATPTARLRKKSINPNSEIGAAK